MSLLRLLKSKVYWLMVGVIVLLDFSVICVILIDNRQPVASSTKGARYDFVEKELDKELKGHIDYDEMRILELEEMKLWMTEATEKLNDIPSPGNWDVFPPGHPCGSRLRHEDRFGPNPSIPAFQRRAEVSVD